MSARCRDGGHCRYLGGQAQAPPCLETSRHPSHAIATQGGIQDSFWVGLRLAEWGSCRPVVNTRTNPSKEPRPSKSGENRGKRSGWHSKIRKIRIGPQTISPPAGNTGGDATRKGGRIEGSHNWNKVEAGRLLCQVNGAIYMTLLHRNSLFFMMLL